MAFTASSLAQTSFAQMFAGLNLVLDKGAAHAKARNIEESVLLGWRLHPDMFPMSRQVQITCDVIMRGYARLAGAEIPSMPDTEMTFGELKARIAKVQDFVKSLDAMAIDARPDGEVTFPAGGESVTMTRAQYLANWIIPNAYFHTTATYAVLRNAGVALGKGDYLAR